MSRMQFTTNSGKSIQLPAFLPVYQPRARAFQLSTADPDFDIEGLIVNSYFLYKQRDIRKMLTNSMGLHEFVGFNGVIATDSGAFQGFTRKLYLKNRDIIRFQDKIGSDVIAPLDLVTPPWDKKTTAEAKLEATNKRIREGLGIVENGILAGVQQGGRFEDLRQRSSDVLMEMGVSYVAIGSLVPFFNRNHDMALAGRITRAARRTIGPDLPMHIYGSGDPVELPFFFALGANLFDSASYGHYARSGHFMTRFGALPGPGPLLAGEYSCHCPICAAASGPAAVFGNEDVLTLHNLWTIHDTIARLRRIQTDPVAFDRYLLGVVEQHMAWFPESDLERSWSDLQAVS